jgi:hypothetical protein
MGKTSIDEEFKMEMHIKKDYTAISAKVSVF